MASPVEEWRGAQCQLELHGQVADIRPSEKSHVTSKGDSEISSPAAAGLDERSCSSKLVSDYGPYMLTRADTDAACTSGRERERAFLNGIDPLEREVL
jgi:hypothetical protein